MATSEVNAIPWGVLIHRRLTRRPSQRGRYRQCGCQDLALLTGNILWITGLASPITRDNISSRLAMVFGHSQVSSFILHSCSHYQ